MNTKKWHNYIIFDKLSCKTYIGSTVNINRRFRQHNREIKGGAKYTRGGKWEPYIVLHDLNHTKSSALSDEWHLKYSSNRCKGSSSYIKRKMGLEKILNSKLNNNFTYTHILFINKKYIHLSPILQSNIMIIYLSEKEFNNEIINKWIEIIDYFNYILHVLNDCNHLYSLI